MNYWVFKCDREKYKLDERLLDRAQSLTWRVTRYADQIKPGDVAFISQTCPDPGIRAVIRIQSIPSVKEEIASEVRFWIAPCKSERRVDAVLEKRCPLISFKALRKAGLKVLSIYSRERATNFQLSQAQGGVILGLVR